MENTENVLNLDQLSDELFLYCYNRKFHQGLKQQSRHARINSSLQSLSEEEKEELLDVLDQKLSTIDGLQTYREYFDKMRNKKSGLTF